MADSFTTEAFTLLAIGLCFIFLRIYARLSKIGMSGFKADDYLMMVAAVVYAAETTLAYTVGAYWQGLANNGMTDAERAALSPTSAEYRLRVNGSKTQVAGWSTYTLLLWLLKASMCTFYLRLTDGLNYHLRIYIGFGVVFTTWVAVLLSILLGCRPLSKNWQIYPDPGNFCQPAISRIDIFVTVVLNVLTDIYLLSIPLPMLWKANLPATRKIGLMVLFSGGIFVTMAGILRCVLILTNPITGAQQAGSWACRETFVAVVTSNLPMIFPLARRYGSPFFSSMRSGMSSKKSKTTGGGGGGGDGGDGGDGGETGNVTSGSARTVQDHGVFMLQDENPDRAMGTWSGNPLPNMTFSESEEYIYNEHLQQQRQDEEHQQEQLQKQYRQSRGSLQQQQMQQMQQGDDIQALPSRSSFLVGRSNSGKSSSSQSDADSGTLATVVRVHSGITKQVVLQVTEEERRRRRSKFGSAESNTRTDELETIPGASQGNYFLTLDNVQQPQQQPQQTRQQTRHSYQTHQPSLSASSSSSRRAANMRNSIAFTPTSMPSVMSPLASSPWDVRPNKDQDQGQGGADPGEDDDKRISTGLTPSSRRR
ncbi:hypothetical protein SCUCBS95973_005762 [Sporothrix curviconia]|uniref:Rhodopsin domain-containing protein n=1 Tax=Sporothrix curviconia TaxID=1260050 RepID=A0ABP0BZI1_9PEZI